MSDPARDGYECHGRMMELEFEFTEAFVTGAFICQECGVWRHAFSPGDPRRETVTARMPSYIEAMLMGITREC